MSPMLLLFHGGVLLCIPAAVAARGSGIVMVVGAK